MIKAVLFDMDGVLVNTETFYIRALIQVLSREIGLKLTEEEVERYAGLVYVEKLRRIFEERNIRADPYELAEKSRRRFLQIVRGKIRLLPGAKDLIDQLRSAGIKLGIVSSSQRKVIELVLDETNLEGVFDVIIAQEDVKHLKPSSEAYLLASRRLGLRSEDCVAIEDSSHGIISAKSAGMKCIAIANPNFPVSNYKEADLVVIGLHEIELETILNL
jgi:HAD superfamily hydrolase (TIGR01509 family)